MSNELLILFAWLMGRLPRVLLHSEMLDLCAKVREWDDVHITPMNTPDWVRVLEGTRKPAFMSSARDLALLDFDYEVNEAIRMVFGYD